MPEGRRKRPFVLRRPSFVVLAAMLLFTVWFSAYSIRLHDAHRTHKADLGQIDLAIWNTAHGRFVQEIKDDQISTRLTDHAEPIFLPVSLVFWLWDDVRALLILQAALLALGAWPIYRIAERRMRSAESASWSFAFPAWGGVIFAAVYLLTPALQAAAVAEFHALALAPACIAWALWAVEDRRWGRFATAAVLLMSVQEGMALLAAMLGVYALASAYKDSSSSPRRHAREASLPDDADKPPEQVLDSGVPDLSGGGRAARVGMGVGAAVLLLGLSWFYATTFVIIPHFASQVYGLDQTPYAARYGELGDSFGGVLKTLITRPFVALRIAVEPLRLQYLIRLLAPTAFLGLLAPEILLLSAPLLLANLFSSFPLQYSGELHYSAPLVPIFILAAIVGLRRFKTQAEPLGGPRAAWLMSLALVAAGALIMQVLAGYTPIGREFRRLAPGAWPQVTAHERLLARFAAQIPADAALSVTTDLYPHLSHRPLIYQFPWLGQARWALVDVAGATDRHPADIQREIGRLLGAGWGVVDGADGYLLLAQGHGAAALPDAFYDFARVAAPQPQYPLDIVFGDRLKLIGYDLLDDVKWRRTALRFYWQPLARLGDDVSVSLDLLAADGVGLADPVGRPAPALLWYPPARWQPGETVIVETLPWYLPRAWAPAVSVYAGGAALPPRLGAGQLPAQATITEVGAARLVAWERLGGWLAQFDEPREKYPTEARFTGDNWAVRLTDTAVRHAAAPGRPFPVFLRWAADMGPAPRDFRVFVHLRNAAGQTIADGDATPTWFTPLPTDRWPRGFATWDAHSVAIPADLAAGAYRLVIGWYDPETGKRLGASSADGNAAGNEYVLGSVIVDPLAGPRPDLICLTVPESCASQE